MFNENNGAHAARRDGSGRAVSVGSVIRVAYLLHWHRSASQPPEGLLSGCRIDFLRLAPICAIAVRVSRALRTNIVHRGFVFARRTPCDMHIGELRAQKFR